MSQKVISKKLEHSPTLNTVLMVENVLKNSDKSAIKIAELKRKVPKQVNHNMIKIILEYLEDSGKIAVGLKGITWIHNTNQNMLRELRKSFVYSGSSLEK